MNKQNTFLENIVLLAIVLVLVQTFLEDLAVVLDLNVTARHVLLFAGLFFDAFFTVEFVTRSYAAANRGAFSQYFWGGYGWVDLLASAPLLLLNSGPAAFAVLAGGLSFVGVGSTLNILKVVKAIRISRVLRLLRALKLFRNIKNTDSVMAQRHVAMIATLTVTVFVFTLLLLASASVVVEIRNLERDYQNRVVRVFQHVESRGLAEEGSAGELASLLDSVGSVLAVELDGQIRYSSRDQEHFDRFYRSADYTVLEQGPLVFYVDMKPLNRDQAATNLRYFLVIVILVGGYVFWYSPRFALTVTDPIHVMRRGLDEGAYNLEVLIPDEHRRDDVYLLARSYNRVFLPMKDRDRAGSGAETDGSPLTLENVGDLFS